jgi:hypothetical protein
VLYKRLHFANVRIVTLSEGDINDMHVGLKGTMAALFLKDLADKTRRGLRERVENGKSGGGNSYGYDVVRQFGAGGEAIRGDRVINRAEAAIVRRIFTEYAQRASPRAIAVRLNKEGIPGPHGPWGASTIHGHKLRGTGILNNELYIGRIVWNRLRYIKDPATGKWVSRLNPENEWIRKHAPHLRILDDDLWEAAHARQTKSAVRTRTDLDRLTDRKRPKHLFSGLLKCSACGGPLVKISAEHYGCARARDKGTCDCSDIVRQRKLEETVLRGLQHHLMQPELVEAFADEYTRHLNRLRIQRSAAKARMQSDLGKVNREIERCLQAILDGVPGSQIKDKMIALEEKKQALEREIRNTPDEPVLIHPNMSLRYPSRLPICAGR